jgi:hypothetical protein
VLDSQHHHSCRPRSPLDSHSHLFQGQSSNHICPYPSLHPSTNTLTPWLLILACCLLNMTPGGYLNEAQEVAREAAKEGVVPVLRCFYCPLLGVMVWNTSLKVGGRGGA